MSNNTISYKELVAKYVDPEDLIPDEDGSFLLEVNATMYLPAEDREWDCIGEEAHFYGAGYESDVSDECLGNGQEGLGHWAQAMANSSGAAIRVDVITTWESWDGWHKDEEESFTVYPEDDNWGWSWDEEHDAYSPVKWDDFVSEDIPF